MTQLHGSRPPFPYFRDADYLVNGAEAVADVPQGLAGVQRYLAEMVDGAITDVEPCALVSASTRLQGHDHSGGLMGRALGVTLWSVSFGQPVDTAPAASYAGFAPRVFVENVNPWKTADLFDDVLACWVPPSPPDGAHGEPWFTVSYHSDAACAIDVRWRGLGLDQTQTITVSASGRADHVVAGRVRCEPGHLQSARITITARRTSADANVSLTALSLVQY